MSSEPTKTAHSPGILLIANERQRQIEEEGWTPDHDDKHSMGQMIGAAITYAGHALEQATDGEILGIDGTEWWPWEDEKWKPSPDPVRNLVKAGALIAAEIDRQMRQLSTPPDHKEAQAQPQEGPR